MAERSVSHWLTFVPHLTLVAVAALTCVATVCTAMAEDQIETRKVIARVNGDPIYEDQIRSDVNKNLADMKRYGARVDDGQLLVRAQLRQLDRVIGNVLVDQASRKRTVENIEEKVEERIDELGNKYGHGAGMDKYLKLRRITMDDLRKSLRVRVRVDEYLTEVGVLDPDIPEEKIRAMYDADPESFSNRATVTASHILVSVDKDAKPEAQEEARQKAEHIRKEILDGKDFAEMAKEHSTCHSASRGGQLGVVRQGFMPSDFDKAAFALKVDELSEVVQTQHGFHIIKISEKVPSELVPYDKMRGFLKKYLQKDESRKRLVAHIAELRKSANIEILLK